MSSGYFYTLILSFTSGIFLRSFFDVDFVWALWLICIGSGLVLWAVYKRHTASVHMVYVLALVFIGSGVGIERYNLAEYSTPVPLLRADVDTIRTYTGEVIREPEVGVSTATVVVQVGEELVLVRTDRHSEVTYGDTISITGKLALPEPFITDTNRLFDYPNYLRAQGIAYTMSFAAVSVVDGSTGNPFLRRLFMAKEKFITALQMVLSEPHVGLGTGLLLGVKQSLGDQLESSFRRAGIIHIVVLSGYNIMLVVWFVLLLLSRVCSLRMRGLVGIVAIIGFALVVGLGASVVRASIMASLGLIALLVGRQYAVTRALFLAGAIMLSSNPYLLVFDVGFQLSFMATLGLLLVAPHLTRFVLWLPERFQIRQFLLATIATQIAVLPILLFNMGQFSLISFVVNVLVLPFVPVAMLLTFLTGLLALVSPLIALPVSFLSYLVLSYIIGVATTFAALPYAVINVPVFPWYFVLLAYMGLGWWLYMRTRKSEQNVYLELAPNVSQVANWTIEEEISPIQTISLNHTKKEPVESTRSLQGEAHTDQSDTPIFFR